MRTLKQGWEIWNIDELLKQGWETLNEDEKPKKQGNLKQGWAT